MIPLFITMWAFSAPMGYLAGDVFAHKYDLNGEVKTVLPWACAVFPFMGAVCALMMILTTEVVEKIDDE